MADRSDDVISKLKNIAWHKGLRWELPSVTDAEDGVEALLRECAALSPPQPQGDVNDVIARSKEFPARFPIDSVRCCQLRTRVPEEQLTRNIRSTYPVLHERTLFLMAEFLLHKRKHGSSVERALYGALSLAGLLDRLLARRALVFMKKQDVWVLLSGERGTGGWEDIGTDRETPPLVLSQCLSYDELKLSALLAVSGRTVCINDGHRKNKGIVMTEGIETDAVIMGIIGPRFQRPGRMECEDLLITEQHNTEQNGYGADGKKEGTMRPVWERFYQLPSATITSVSSLKPPVSPRDGRVFSARYSRRPGAATIILDAAAVHRRLTVLADVILLEADSRAQEDGRMAFVNIIGAGLGVWKISPHQQELFVLSMLISAERLLRGGRLRHVADVNFAYIKPAPAVLKLFQKYEDSEDNLEKYKLFFKQESHPNGGISIWLWSREPAAALRGRRRGALAALTYAWDGNAHPGNEFWLGKLATSGDPAAACSTQVAELHSASINTNVCARNTRVASRFGLLHIGEYCRRVLGDK